MDEDMNKNIKKAMNKDLDKDINKDMNNDIKKDIKKDIKLVILVLGLFVILFCIPYKVYTYLSTYNIIDNDKIFEKEISQRIGMENVEIKDYINIQNNKYVLIKVDNQLGYAEFTKGLNNKYKIGSISYGTMTFNYEIFKINKAKYFILLGNNLDNKINYAKLSLEDRDYKIDIPKQEYYLAFCKVHNTDIIFPDVNSIKFFDEYNTDITKKILFQ